ncbi:uncharacterized protein TNCV_436781 [Trichonephila clavipes]|nr:uncharacterized protein TNCV_436781 [Trichonephila clavipes]
MCNSGLDMQVLKGKSGLAITFVLKCFACPYRVEFSSSNFHEGTQIATINTRFVYAMRSIGKGAEAGRMFCGVMNLPQPPTRFSPYGKRILNAAKLVYEDSIQNAAKEAICENEGNKNIAVAVDGTWQKRGYTSLNGVVTVTSIDTGKVIDVDILSKYCACKNLPFHEKDCKRNYVGSSGAMEIQDGKCLSGKNRLTEHEMDNLQSFYGSAIRRNHSSVQNMHGRLGIRQVKTVVYRPQANKTEHVNRDLVRMIANYVNEQHDTWDQFFREFAYAIRTTVNEITGKPLRNYS